MSRRVLVARDSKMKKTNLSPLGILHFSSEKEATNQQNNYSVLSAGKCYKNQESPL